MKTSFSHTSNPNRLNNIVYVEPNYHNSAAAYDSSGLNVFEQAPDLSDYSIFVNLEVEVVGRTIKSEVNHYVVSWQSKAGSQESTVNFMEGSKIPLGESGKYINALTTNYTDCFLTDLKRIGGNTEMFGISSIDIAYNNYMVPEVTIEFVDVRGAALFSPRESQDGNDGALSQEQYDTAGSFFQCFFTFPYPKFTLLVKGFYGQPVSYELTCSDFRAKFDAQTGNFACTAKFVGYAFSFLSDVMVNAMVAAPYSDYIGADYWDAQNFELPGTNGGTYKMPKLAQLIEDAKNILANAEKEKEQNPAIIEANERESASNIITNEIRPLYKEFCDALGKTYNISKKINEQHLRAYSSYNNGDEKLVLDLLILTEDENGGKYYRNLDAVYGTMQSTSGAMAYHFLPENIKSLKTKYEALKEKINDFNESNHSHSLPIPSNILNFKSYQVIKYDKHSNIPLLDLDENGVNVVNNEKSKSVIEIGLKKNAGTYLSQNYSGYTYGFLYSDNGLVEAMDNIVNSTEAMKDELAELEQKALDEAVANQLGFWPSVENITRIIMAHFETFAKMIHKTGIEICSSNPLRTASSLGIASDELPDVIKDSTDNFVPPFPKVVKKVAANGTVTEEDAWVGDFSGDFREKDLVHGLLNGITAVAKIVNSSSDNTEMYSNGSYGSNREERTAMPYPLAAVDFVSTANTYNSLNSDSLNDLTTLLSLVIVRAINILDNNRIFKDTASATDIGQLDAKNLLDAVRGRIGANIKNRLKSINDAQTYVNELINELCANKGKKPWQTETPMFIKKGDKYILNIFKYGSKLEGGNPNATCLPIWGHSNFSWSSMNQTYSKAETCGKPVYDVNRKETPNTYKKYNGNNYKRLLSIETDIDRITNIITANLGELKDKTNCLYTWNDYQGSISTNGFENTLYHEKKSEDEKGLNIKDGCKIFPTVNEMGNKRDVKPFSHGFPGPKDVLGDKVSDEEINEYGEKLVPILDTCISNFNYDYFGHVYHEHADYLIGKDYVKALLFLGSIPFSAHEKVLSKLSDEKSQIVYAPLMSLLYIGGIEYARQRGLTKLPDEISTNKNDRKMPLTGKSSPHESIRGDVLNHLVKLFDVWVSDNAEYFNAMIANDKICTFKEIQKHFVLRESTENFDKNLTYYQILKQYGPNLFNSYISIGGGKNNPIMRPNSEGARKLMRFVMTGCAVIKYSKLPYIGQYDSKYIDITVKQNDLNNFLTGFVKELIDQTDEESDTNDHINQAEVPANATTEIKIAVYRYCKLLYDKWIGGLTEEKFVSDWTKDRFFDESSNSEHDQYFHFIDCYYNKVGQRVPINLGDLCEQIQNCWQQGQYSLLSLLSDMYAKNKMQFLCVQNFKSLTDGMETLFDPIPYLEMTEPKRHPNFIVVYPYEASSKLDMEGQEYVNDTFMISQPISSRNKWPEALKSRSLGVYSGYNIPAFGVTYGKMYQSYFTGFDVNMNNPTVTEQSIKAMFQIASMNNEGEADEKRAASETVGQDLFTIYSNNSYDCTVTMMGCPWVQPLMYFCLNNVPMFRGTYQIINVNHHLEPGNMTTTFKGVRMANTATRIVREIFLRNTTDRTGTMEGPSIENTQANVDNDCEYKTYPLIYGSTDLSAFTDKPSSAGAITQNALIVMNYLMSNGFTKEAAAGICGNIMQESSWSLGANDGRGAYGLCQWMGDRKAELLRRGNNKPSLEVQLQFIVYEWDNESIAKNHKGELLAAKSPERAAEIVCDYFERPKASDANKPKRKEYARSYYNSYGATPIRTESGDDKKVSDLANGFLDAINKTAQSSAIGGIVTLDTGLSAKNTLWLKKAANGCELSSIFDVVVNAYYDKIESAYWVTSANSSKGEPSYIIVNVKEGSPSKTIKVVDSNQRPLNIINDLPDNFYRTIAKRYHFRKNGSDCVHDNTFAKEVPQFADHADVICNKAEIRDCGEILSELGAGGVVVNGYIGDWNVGLFVKKLHYWQRNICTGGRQSYGGCSACTGVINRALAESGYGPLYSGKYWAEYPWQVYDKMKVANSDFVEIDSGTSAANSGEINFSKQLQVGDICVMWKSRNANDKKGYHTTAYNGKQWVSDYIQRRCRPNYPNTVQWHLMRHKGDAKINN